MEPHMEHTAQVPQISPPEPPIRPNNAYQSTQALIYQSCPQISFLQSLVNEERLGLYQNNESEDQRIKKELNSQILPSICCPECGQSFSKNSHKCQTILYQLSSGSSGTRPITSCSKCLSSGRLSASDHVHMNSTTQYHKNLLTFKHPGLIHMVSNDYMVHKNVQQNSDLIFQRLKVHSMINLRLGQCFGFGFTNYMFSQDLKIQGQALYNHKMMQQSFSIPKNRYQILRLMGSIICDVLKKKYISIEDIIPIQCIGFYDLIKNVTPIQLLQHCGNISRRVWRIQKSIVKILLQSQNSYIKKQGEKLNLILSNHAQLYVCHQQLLNQNLELDFDFMDRVLPYSLPTTIVTQQHLKWANVFKLSKWAPSNSVRRVVIDENYGATKIITQEKRLIQIFISFVGRCETFARHVAKVRTDKYSINIEKIDNQLLKVMSNTDEFKIKTESHLKYTQAIHHLQLIKKLQGLIKTSKLKITEHDLRKCAYYGDMQDVKVVASLYSYKNKKFPTSLFQFQRGKISQKKQFYLINKDTMKQELIQLMVSGIYLAIGSSGVTYEKVYTHFFSKQYYYICNTDIAAHGAKVPKQNMKYFSGVAYFEEAWSILLSKGLIYEEEDLFYQMPGIQTVKVDGRQVRIKDERQITCEVISDITNIQINKMKFPQILQYWISRCPNKIVSKNDLIVIGFLVQKKHVSWRNLRKQIITYIKNSLTEKQVDDIFVNVVNMFGKTAFNKQTKLDYVSKVVFSNNNETTEYIIPNFSKYYSNNRNQIENVNCYRVICQEDITNEEIRRRIQQNKYTASTIKRSMDSWSLQIPDKSKTMYTKYWINNVSQSLLRKLIQYTSGDHVMDLSSEIFKYDNNRKDQNHKTQIKLKRRSFQKASVSSFVQILLPHWNRQYGELLASQFASVIKSTPRNNFMLYPQELKKCLVDFKWDEDSVFQRLKKSIGSHLFFKDIEKLINRQFKNAFTSYNTILKFENLHFNTLELSEYVVDEVDQDQQIQSEDAISFICVRQAISNKIQLDTKQIKQKSECYEIQKQEFIEPISYQGFYDNYERIDEQIVNDEECQIIVQLEQQNVNENNPQPQPLNDEECQIIVQLKQQNVNENNQIIILSEQQNAICELTNLNFKQQILIQSSEDYQGNLRKIKRQRRNKLKGLQGNDNNERLNENILVKTIPNRCICGQKLNQQSKQCQNQECQRPQRPLTQGYCHPEIKCNMTPKRLKLQNCPLNKNENNLKQIILNDGYTLTQQLQWSFSQESTINMNFIHILSSQDNAKIYYFQQNFDSVALQIREVSQEVGKGVFATQKMKKGTFIGHYSGEICESFNCPISQRLNNSIIQIGWLKQRRSLLMLFPYRYANHGRYLNGSKKPNVNGQWHVYETLSGTKKLGFALWTNKAINAGEQLVWNYGNSFFRHDGGCQRHLKNEVKSTKNMKKIN